MDGRHDDGSSSGTMMEDLLKVIDGLPFISSVRRDLNTLSALLYERRAPSVAVLGLPRSGRTSLANALLSADALPPHNEATGDEPVEKRLADCSRWLRINAAGRRLNWLELDAHKPTHELRQDAQQAWEERVPDLLLVLVAAHRLEASAPQVLKSLDALQALLADRGQGSTAADAKNAPPKPIPIMVLLTQVDHLPPAEADSPPYPASKRTAIELSLQSLRSMFKSRGLPESAFLAIAAGGVESDGVQDKRWNVKAVAEAMLEALPKAAQLEAARSFDVGQAARAEIARTLVNSCAALGVTIGLAPIPFADALFLLPLQAAMVTGTAYLSGRPWDRRAAAEWIASVGVVGGAGLGLRWGVQQALKFLPGGGTLLGASVAGAGTLAIGRSAIAYFIEGPGAPTERTQLCAEIADTSGQADPMPDVSPAEIPEIEVVEASAEVESQNSQETSPQEANPEDESPSQS